MQFYETLSGQQCFSLGSYYKTLWPLNFFLLHICKTRPMWTMACPAGSSFELRFTGLWAPGKLNWKITAIGNALQGHTHLVILFPWTLFSKAIPPFMSWILPQIRTCSWCFFPVVPAWNIRFFFDGNYSCFVWSSSPTALNAFMLPNYTVFKSFCSLLLAPILTIKQTGKTNHK